MTADVALRVAARFGVEGVAANELRGGWVNDNWLDDARDGGRFVIRRYRRLQLTRRAVAFEHAVMHHVAAHVSEVHPPLRDSGGDSIYVEGGSYYAVFPYVDGRTGVRTIANAAAGVLVGFHRASAGFQPARPRCVRSADALAWLRDRFVQFAERPELARKIDWGALIAGVSGALAQIRPRTGRLPLATVHGDPHPDNFVVRDGRIVALIDFDFTHETERVYDVAAGADAFARDDEDASLDLGRATIFAAVYHPEIGDDEWALLPEFMIRRNAFLTWYVVTRHGERAFGDIGNAERYARRVAEIARLREGWRRPS